MSQVSWTDKVNLNPKTSRVNQWWDIDANEVKAAINDNDTRIVNLEESGDSSLPATFEKKSGNFIGTRSAPITGTISLSKTGSIKGGLCAVWLQAPTLSFSGDGSNDILVSGSINANEICLVWIIYHKTIDQIIASVQTFTSSNDIAAPATMTITEVLIDTTLPSTMTITNIILT